MQHHKGAITDQRIDLALRLGQLRAQRRIDLVTHAGVAIFDVIGVVIPGAPDTLQVARQAARGCHDDRLFRQLLIEGAEHAALRQQGLCQAAELRKYRLAIQMVSDLRHKVAIVIFGLIDALRLFQQLTLRLRNLTAPVVAVVL